jgi:hypothetical protein
MLIEVIIKLAAPSRYDVYQFQEKLVLGGFVKKNEACPVLISKSHKIIDSIKCLRLEYFSVGKNYEDWINEKEVWGNAMNVTFYQVKRGRGINSIVLYVIEGISSDDEVIEVSHDKY